jgi:hypothetical protein
VAGTRSPRARQPVQPVEPVPVLSTELWDGYNPAAAGNHDSLNSTTETMGENVLNIMIDEVIDPPGS